MENWCLYYSKCLQLACLYRQSSAVLINLHEMKVENTGLWADLVVLSNIPVTAQLHCGGNYAAMAVIP